MVPPTTKVNIFHFLIPMGTPSTRIAENIISFCMHIIITIHVHYDREQMKMQQPGRVSSAQYDPDKSEEHDDSPNGLFSYLLLFKQKMAEYHTE